MRLVVGLAFAVIAFTIPVTHTLAAGDTICGAYATEATAKAQGVRQLDCGYDLKDPRWAMSRDDHARWCRASAEKTVAAETAQRRGQMQLCVTCRAYASEAAQAVAQNGKLNCGFTGPRWNVDARTHFAWCMSLPDELSQAAPQGKLRQEIEKTINLETGERITRIQSCKLQ